MAEYDVVDSSGVKRGILTLNDETPAITAKVNTGGLPLRVRAGAGTSFAQVGSIANGTIIRVIDLGSQNPSADGFTWVQTEALYQGKRGWVARELLIIPFELARVLGADFHKVPQPNGQPGVIDWQALKDAGIRYVYFKVTEGNSYFSDRFLEHRAKAKQYGFKFGCWHWLTPGVSPESQADWCNDHLGMDYDLPLAIDVEGSPNPRLPNVNEIARFEQAYRQLAGRKQVVYSRDNLLSQLGDLSPLTGLGYWKAEEKDGKPFEPTIFPPFTQVLNHQYNLDVMVPWATGRVDLDHGYLDEMIEYARPTTATPIGLAPLTGHMRVVDKQNGRDNPFGLAVGTGAHAAYSQFGVNIDAAVVCMEQIPQFFYAEGNHYVNIQPHQWAENLDYLRNRGQVGIAHQGMSVVRLFLPHESIVQADQSPDTGRLITLLRKRLDELAARDLKALICFNSSVDYYYFHEEEEYRNLGGLGYLNYGYWKDKAHRIAMLPLCRTIIREFKDHPAVFGWQFYNEPHVNGHTRDTVLYFRDAINELTRMAHDEDPVHPKLVGLRHVGDLMWEKSTKEQAAELFWGLSKTSVQTPYVHIVSAHFYPLEASHNFNDPWEDQDYVYYTLFNVGPGRGSPSAVDEMYTWIPKPEYPDFDPAEQLDLKARYLYERGVMLVAWWRYTNVPQVRLGDNKRAHSVPFHRDGILIEGNPAYFEARRRSAIIGNEFIPQVIR